MKVAAQKNILLVDKDALLRELMRMHLGMYGYSLVEAGDGFEAIKQVKDHAVDLVILELDLPVMDGMEFMRLLRNELQSSVPVLVLTMVDLLAVRDELLELGMAHMVSKPIGGAELLARVDELLLQRTARHGNSTDSGDRGAS